MNRVTTGSPQLDRVLGGGVFPGSLVVISGAPGAGKTVLAQQMCFAAARRGRRAVYYTTLSEPHNKLEQHLSAFSFFDPALLERDVEFLHAGAVLGQPGPAARLDDLTAEVRRKTHESEPAVIVIDSSRSLVDYAQPHVLRSVFYELAADTGHSDTVLLLVGEYTAADVATAPEFAVADAIVHLWNEPVGEMNRRWLRVLKMRGSNYLDGRHSFDISDSGVRVHPRLERIATPPAAKRIEPRLSTGDAGLDRLLSGGIPPNDSLLVTGPSGVGKTLLSLQFVHDGIVRGEPCLYVSLQESAADLIAKAAAFGWRLERAVATGELQLIHVPPVEVNLDEVGGAIAAAVEQRPVTRVVVDSLAELLVARESDRLASYVWALSGLVATAGGTLLATDESRSTGIGLVGDLGVFFDDVIRLDYTTGDASDRSLEVQKMRRSPHSPLRTPFAVVQGRGLVVDVPAE